MKLTILIITVCLLQVSALTKAQITIIAKQESLRNVLEKISQQSGYDFIYSVQDFKNANPVDLKLNNVGLEKALSAAFYGQPLIYEVSDKTVMVKKREEKSYLETIIDRFQAIDVRGKVVDSLGVGIAGATVSIKNGKGSTSTAANGDFYLKNVEEGALLVISFMGYVTKEQVASKDFNYVILKQSTSQLDEVLVQAYGTTTRRLSTGNIAMITSKEISQQNINNPLLALQGRVAGVEVIPTNGLPGAPVNIKIRGQYTILDAGEGNEPLIIIDGVPQTNNISGLGSMAGGGNSTTAGQISSFSYINPNEIESISVLKDADATSIYGSRGSKGVILITTKKGRVGQTVIDVTVNSGWQDVAKKIELLNTQQYLEMKKEALKNDNRLPRLDNPIVYAGIHPDLLVWDQNKYTDWQDVLLGNTARYTDIQGALSGGVDNIQYRLGGNYHREGYVFKGNSFDQKGLINISITGSSPNKKFKAQLTSGYLFNKNNSVPEDFTKFAMTLAPNAPDLYTVNGELNWTTNPYSVEGLSTFTSNPMRLLKRPFNQNINTLISSAVLSYEIIPQLVLKTSIGYNKLDGKSFRINTNQASSTPESLPYLQRSATFMKTGTESWSIEPQVTYSINMGNGHLDALFGGALQNQKASSEMIGASGFSSDAVMHALSQATTYFGIGNNSSEYKYSAVFARLNYNWENKYLVNLNGRRDGSSRFGPGRQFGNFWSIGTAWIFSQEKLLRSLSPLISFGKMRFSYGTSGNDGIGDYRFFETYNPVNSVRIYRGIKLLSSLGLSNPYFGWETVKKIEFGLDLGFLSDRLNFSTVFFRNRSSNLLGDYQLPMIVGPSNIAVNQPALIQTGGWEFLLNSKNIATPRFSWNTTLNLGFTRNKMLAANDGDRTRPEMGKPFYGYVYPVIFYGVDATTGQYQFLGKDGQPTFHASDAASTEVRVQPLFSGGLGNSLNYKNFSLDFFVQFVKQNGRDYIYQFPLAGSQDNLPVVVMDRWKSSGDHSLIQRFTSGSLTTVANPVPGITLRDAYEAAGNSTLGWIDASFIRLKTISLSYSLGDFAKQIMKIKSFRVFAQGQNLFTWTNYMGTDPETQNPFVLPPLRTITAGIQLTL